MKSFRMEFDDLFAEGLILGLEIGLGASGELKYPSFSERMGWSYPGIGEFQVLNFYQYPSLFSFLCFSFNDLSFKPSTTQYLNMFFLPVLRQIFTAEST